MTASWMLTRTSKERQPKTNPQPITNLRRHTMSSILSSVPTCDLVQELEAREGIEKIWVNPYEDFKVKVNGPAVVLVVTD